MPDTGPGETHPILAKVDDPSLNEWHTGLFDCFEDCHLTAVGLFCPQCLHADNATRLDRFATCCPYQCSYLCLHALLLCSLVGGHHRRELRTTFSLPETPCGDHWVHCFCSLCALCQEAREIKRRSNIRPAPRMAAALTRKFLPPEVQHMARSYSHGLALDEWEWDEEGGRIGPGARNGRRVAKPVSLVAPKAKAIRHVTDGGARGPRSDGGHSVGSGKPEASQKLESGNTSVRSVEAPLSPFASTEPAAAVKSGPAPAPQSGPEPAPPARLAPPPESAPHPVPPARPDPAPEAGPELAPRAEESGAGEDGDVDWEDEETDALAITLSMNMVAHAAVAEAHIREQAREANAAVERRLGRSRSARQ